MTAVFLVRGNAYMGANKIDADENVTESTPARFETQEDGSCVAVGKFDPDTGTIQGIDGVYGDFHASGYLKKTLEMLHPDRQLDVPDFKSIFKTALREGDLDYICEYCPRCDCRDCIVNIWKQEETQ